MTKYSINLEGVFDKSAVIQYIFYDKIWAEISFKFIIGTTDSCLGTCGTSVL